MDPMEGLLPPLSLLPGFSALQAGLLQPDPRIGVIALARPAKSNAFDAALFEQLPRAVKALEAQETLRVIVLMGQGKNFCGGLDLSLLRQLFQGSMGTQPQSTQQRPQQQGQQAQEAQQQHWRQEEQRQQQQQQGQLQQPQQQRATAACPARAREALRAGILQMQAAYTAFEECRWPVIAAVQGACVGAGIDMCTACDLRYCTKNAAFCVKEVDLAITADLGTLQRLPKIVGHGAAADMALTARNVTGAEAAAMGLVARCFDSRADMMAHVMHVAGQLAAKPPLALVGTKRILLHSRDHASVSEGLQHVALYNSAFLLSGDMEVLLQAMATKQQPVYSKL